MKDDQQRRYARHIVLPQIGAAGQAKLLAASVLVVGAGGLGSTALMFLAAAGIGRLGICEHDRVELSNLQRQTLYETADIGRFKATAAADRLCEMNPDSTVETHLMRLDATNVDALIAAYDVIVDGTDNYETRYIINDACLRAKKPWVYGAMVGFDAQMASFVPEGACYRCFIPEKPERERSCAQEGIIGPLAGVVGSLQALEVVKLVTGAGEMLAGKLLIVNGLTMEFRKAALMRDVNCCH